MNQQDTRWYLGLAATVVVVCLLAAGAFSAFLFATVERDDVDAWMQSVGSTLVARIPALPESRPEPAVNYVAAGQSPFAADLLRPQLKSSR